MKLVAALMITLGMIFPLQGCAETPQKSQEQMLTILRGEVEGIYDKFSPVPFRPIRKMELDRLLVSAGYEWHPRIQDYTKRGLSEEGRRREEYVVMPTFCAALNDRDPWVSALVFQAKGIRGEGPAEFIERVGASSVLLKFASVFKGPEYSTVYFQAIFPFGEQGQVFLGSGEAQTSASDEYTQRILLAMEATCPVD